MCFYSATTFSFLCSLHRSSPSTRINNVERTAIRADVTTQNRPIVNYHGLRAKELVYLVNGRDRVRGPGHRPKSTTQFVVRSTRTARRKRSADLRVGGIDFLAISGITDDSLRYKFPFIFRVCFFYNGKFKIKSKSKKIFPR